MIFLGDNTYEKAILQRVLQTPNPYNVRIYSLFHAYKHTALCQFWVQRTGERSVSFLAKMVPPLFWMPIPVQIWKSCLLL